MHVFVCPETSISQNRQIYAGMPTTSQRGWGGGMPGVYGSVGWGIGEGSIGVQWTGITIKDSSCGSPR